MRICFFNALKCIDPVTNLVEMVRVKNNLKSILVGNFRNVGLTATRDQINVSTGMVANLSDGNSKIS